MANSETGHCAKTVAIIKHLAERPVSDAPYWFVIVDDDTIIGYCGDVLRLRSSRLHRFNRLLFV